MTIPVQKWHCDSVAWSAVTAWATGASKNVGDRVRQNAAPSAGNERVFVCIVAGTTHATTEPTWGVTKGAKTTDNTVTWQEVTGQASMNGNKRDTITWLTVKNQAVALGFIIKDASALRYFICTTAGTTGNGAEPTWNTSVGGTTADNTVTWTTLGVVGNFTTAFGAPHSRITSAWTTNWGAAGDTLFVGDDHAETFTSTYGVTYPGTNAAPNKMLDVDHTKVEPTTGDLKDTASITITGNSNFSFVGQIYLYGIQFIWGSAANQNFFSWNHAYALYEACLFKKLDTGATTNAFISNGTSIVDLKNCKFWFGSTGDSICVLNNSNSQGTAFRWRDTPSGAVQGGGSIPTNLFRMTALGCLIELENLDLSALGSGKNIFNQADSITFATMVNCKLGASVGITAANPSRQCPSIDVINCDSTTPGNRQERYRFEGTLTTESTIVRAGGATDGTNQLSWKLVSTSDANFLFAFEAFTIDSWEEITGSPVTRTIEIVNDGVTLNDNDIWMDVAYKNSSGNPGADIVTTRPDALSAGSALPTSSVTWTTTGLGSPVKQYLQVTFTPQLKGYARYTVRLAKASQTVYVDPRVH